MIKEYIKKLELEIQKDEIELSKGNLTEFGKGQLEVTKAIVSDLKILSNERETVRKHEQAQEVCLPHCPNKTKALVKCEWLDKTCFLCMQTE